MGNPGEHLVMPAESSSAAVLFLPLQAQSWQGRGCPGTGRGHRSPPDQHVVSRRASLQTKGVVGRSGILPGAVIVYAAR